MKEISFLLFKRDIFDPLPPEIPTLFIGFEDDDAYSFTKKVQRKKCSSPAPCHCGISLFPYLLLFLFYCLSNGVKSKASWQTGVQTDGRMDKHYIKRIKRAHFSLSMTHSSTTSFILHWAHHLCPQLSRSLLMTKSHKKGQRRDERPQRKRLA